MEQPDDASSYTPDSKRRKNLEGPSRNGIAEVEPGSTQEVNAPTEHLSQYEPNGSVDYQIIPVVSYDPAAQAQGSLNEDSFLTSTGKENLLEVLRKYRGALLLPNIYERNVGPQVLALPNGHESTVANALLLRKNNFLVETDGSVLDSTFSEAGSQDLETEEAQVCLTDRSSEPKDTPACPTNKSKAQSDHDRAVEEARKKVRFSTSDMEADTNFRITLSIKNEANGQTVFYKADKKRFRREKTIKLMVKSFYRVDISFKPTQTVARALIGGEEVRATERVHDSTASAYSLYLPTITMTPSRKGHRDELVLIIQLKNGLLLQLSLQIKLYKQGDSQHCEWGSTFHCVEYECEVYTEAGIVTIIKETFR